MPTFPEGPDRRDAGGPLEAEFGELHRGVLHRKAGRQLRYGDGDPGRATPTAPQNITAPAQRGVYRPSPLKQQTVAADGSTVVKVYYELNTYQIKVPDRFSEIYEKTYRHGETITAPHVAKEGYTFAYWYSDYGTTHFVEGTAATETLTIMLSGTPSLSL